jgi:dienelactone hydrolase
LEAIVLRPKGDGPFPLAVMTVGPIDLKDRAALSPLHFHYQAAEFARRGWAAVFFLRRGYGKSGGEADAWNKACSAENIAAMAKKTADEYEAVIRHFAGQPFVDKTQILAVGQGAAGASVMALAGNTVAGLRGVVNFGASGGSCPDAALLQSVEAAGWSAKVPALWLYAENDATMPPQRVKLFFDAYRQAGGKGELMVTKPFEQDGASLFFWRQGIALWREPVDMFLRQASLLTWSTPPEGPVMPDYPMPDDLTRLNKAPDWVEKATAAWASYFAAPPGKAFVIGVGFGFSAWSTIAAQATAEEAQKIALKKCDDAALKCRIVAVDDEMVGQ